MIHTRTLNRNRRNERGFTFLEVVMAVSILVLIMGIVYGALTQISRAKKALDDQRDLKYIADAVLGRFTRELQLAYPLGALIPPADKLDQPYPGQPPLYSEGTAENARGAGAYVTFLALEGGQYLPDGGTHTGVVQITYRIERNRENPSTNRLVLVRDEVPYTRPFEDAYKKRMTFPITDSVLDLSFHFYDCRNEVWSTDWGKPPRTGFPSLMSFSVTLQSPMGRTETFRSTVFIPSSIQSQQCP